MGVDFLRICEKKKNLKFNLVLIVVLESKDLQLPKMTFPLCGHRPSILFVRSFVRSCVPACVRSFVCSCVRSFVRSFVRSCVRACGRTCVRSFIHSGGPSRVGRLSGQSTLLSMHADRSLVDSLLHSFFRTVSYMSDWVYFIILSHTMNYKQNQNDNK